MHFIYYINRLTATKVDPTYLGCLTSNAQRICPVAGLERLTTGSVVSALPYRASQVDEGIMVNGEIVYISDSAVHLGHNISTSDRDSMILAAKRAFWKSYNNFVSNFCHLYSLLKISVFAPFYCSF